MNKINKIIVFDGQVFQSAAWDRGMGKYSLCLLGALLSNSQFSYSNVYIIFTKHLNLKDATKIELKKVAPNAKFIFLDLKIPESSHQSSIKNLQKHNEKVLNKFVTYLDDSVDFFILSLFIDQVCSVFPSCTRNILLFYDLIPLQYFTRYYKLGAFHNYLARFKTIFEANTIFTISQTVADDLSLFIGINQKTIININGAHIERNHQKPKKPNIPIPKRFILMPSGNDLRKNNFRAVQAFELYRKKYSDFNIKLVITSSFDEITKNQLTLESENLIFTGNVSEPNLRWLYEHSECLLFVSEYEGLGLPILESVETQKPIVCSKLNVFYEISKTAFHYANQFDPIEIAESIKKAIEGVESGYKFKEYENILKKYTWENTVKKVFSALSSEIIVQEFKKPKIAVFSPNPSSYSAIGKVVMLLHPELSKYFNIDYYFENGKTQGIFNRPNHLPDITNTFDASEFSAKKYSEYDFVIYHVGNSEFHLETIKNALHLPGYAVIHDTHLNGVFEGVLLTYKYITDERLSAEKKLNELQKTNKTSYLSSILNNQLGIIVHSRYASLAVKSTNPNKIPILHSNLPTSTPRIIRSSKNNIFNIGFAGIIHKAKGLNVLDRIAKTSSFFDAQISVFGTPLVSIEVLKQLESFPNVSVETNLTDFEFQNKMAQLDVLVNFRPEYKGETSLSTIEAMRFGVVPIVRNVGWYSELPDNCVIKVSRIEELIDALEDFSLDINKQTEMSQNARTYIDQNYSYEKYAQSLNEFTSNVNKK